MLTQQNCTSEKRKKQRNGNKLIIGFTPRNHAVGKLKKKKIAKHSHGGILIQDTVDAACILFSEAFYLLESLRLEDCLVPNFSGPTKQMPKTHHTPQGARENRALSIVYKSFRVSQVGTGGMELPRCSAVSPGNSLFTHFFLQLGSGWPNNLCTRTDKVTRNPSKEDF